MITMRKHYIDNLRWIVILLLIPYHAAQAFNTWGELNYIVLYPDKVISSLIVFMSPFYMPLMFALAGMSTCYALKKRTYGQFLTERVKRLLVPFVFSTLFFCPILAYIGDCTNMGYNGGFFEHYKIFFTRWTDLSGFDGGFGVGQFWFLYYLFVISLVSAGLFALTGRIGKKEDGRCIPFAVVCLLVIPLPFLYGILAVGGKSFAEYLYVFLVGYYVLSDEKVLDAAERYRGITFAVALLSGIVNVYLFLWSGKDFGMVNTVAKALTEWFMILSLLGIAKKRLDFQGRVSGYFSSRAFLFFSIHFLWVVLFQVLLRDLLAGHTALLYSVSVLLSYLATALCAEICIRIPPLRFLMGVK